MRYFIYNLINILMLLVKVLSKQPIGSKFFKEIIAAHSVGVGTEAYQEKRYDDAFKVLKPVADYNIKDVYVGSAQYIVGLMYYHGLGVQNNFNVAVKYLKNAKDSNHEDAARMLDKILSANDI